MYNKNMGRDAQSRHNKIQIGFFQQRKLAREQWVQKVKFRL